MPMNCDLAIEYLPWLLNGTLEAGERDEVRRHLATCESCRAALNDTREAWTIFGQHLPSDALVALAYGEAPAGVDPDVAERHLASCPECAAELELARTSRRLEEDDRIAVFPGRSPRVETPRETKIDRGWSRRAAMAAGIAALVGFSGWFSEHRTADQLGQQLAQASRPVAVQPAPAPAGAPNASAPASVAEELLRSQLQASQAKQDEMAKSLEAASGKLASIEQKADVLLKPQVNPWSDSVTGSSDVVRGAGKPEEQVLPASRLAVPILGADSTNSVRDVEILDDRGSVLWSGSGLRSTEGQEYKLAIPPGFLKAGHYTIQLYETGKRVKRESYRIRVE
jgi:anti-sigma factor RsiW